MKLFFIFISFLALTVQAGAQYQFLKLAFQWTPTVCILQPCDRGKMMNFKPNFYIHGLWPANYSLNQPQRCTLDNYDANDPHTVYLKNNYDLHDFWPNMLSPDDDSFWRWEFEKHGTCMLGPNFHQGDYFQAALDLTLNLWSTADIEVTLGFPGYNSNYQTMQIVSNLQNQYQVRLEVACDPARIDLLMEVRFCYDVFFHLINCPFPRSYCDQNYIKLPL